MNKTSEKVGFLESQVGRKSNSRLTIFICSLICIIAACSEAAAKFVKGTPADWVGIGILVSALLLGNGVLKFAQNIGYKQPTKTTSDDQSA